MIYGEELGGGGISTKTIPPQGLNLTLKGGNGKIDCTFTGIASQWLYLGQYYRLIATRQCANLPNGRRTG